MHSVCKYVPEADDISHWSFYQLLQKHAKFCSKGQIRRLGSKFYSLQKTMGLTYNNSEVETLHFIMAALRSRCGHYIFICGFFFLLLFFSPNLSGRRLDVYHTYVHTWCGLSANLECRSEMCCARLAAGRKSRQKSPSRHHRTTFSGYIVATKAHIDNRRKLVKQQYVLHMSHNMVNFGPLAAEIFG